MTRGKLAEHARAHWLAQGPVWSSIPSPRRGVPLPVLPYTAFVGVLCHVLFLVCRQTVPLARWVPQAP